MTFEIPASFKHFHMSTTFLAKLSAYLDAGPLRRDIRDFDDMYKGLVLFIERNEHLRSMYNSVPPATLVRVGSYGFDFADVTQLLTVLDVSRMGHVGDIVSQVDSYSHQELYRRGEYNSIIDMLACYAMKVNARKLHKAFIDQEQVGRALRIHIDFGFDFAQISEIIKSGVDDEVLDSMLEGARHAV